MKKGIGIIILGLLWCNTASALPKCEGYDPKKWTNCEGSFDYPDKKYSGEWKDGKRNGHGTSILSDGAKYVGEWKEDQPNGQGTMTDTFQAYNIKYIGEWKDGTPNGQGILTCLPGGTKYTPEWDTKEYTGEWKHGTLKIKIENGNEAILNAEQCGIYEGEFKDDLAFGQGTQTFPDGSKYVGEWKEDQPNGQGTNTFANGDKYVGEFKDGKWHGRGTYIEADGDKYVGEWKEGKPNGQGTETLADGRVNKGIWENGKLVKEQ